MSITSINVELYVRELDELKNVNIIKLNEFKKNMNLLNEIIDNITCDKITLESDIKQLFDVSNEMNNLMKQIINNLDLN
jgi:argininosuccinate lyase